MTINRIADLRYDKENPRTKMRALATGALSIDRSVDLPVAWTGGGAGDVMAGAATIHPNVQAVVVACTFKASDNFEVMPIQTDVKKR